MTASLREHLGIRNALNVILTLASYFVFVAVAAAIAHWIFAWILSG